MKKLINIILFLSITGCTATISSKVPSANSAVKAELITKIKAKVNSDEAKKLLINNVDLEKLSVEQLQELDTKITEPISSPTPSPIITSSPLPSPTNTPSPLPTPTTSPIPTRPASSSLSCSGPNGGPMFCSTPSPEPTPPYSVSLPVPPETRSGTLTLTFKDEFKVRYNQSQKMFYSEIGKDTANINNLVLKYKVLKISDALDGMSQERADEEERSFEAYFGYDYSNRASKCTLMVENINVKEFVEALRADPLVRQAGLTGPIGY